VPLDEARKAKEEGFIRHIAFSFHDTPERWYS
jgi:predicted aldo/keto reductase-like oxidoreductase